MKKVSVITTLFLAATLTLTGCTNTAPPKNNTGNTQPAPTSTEDATSTMEELASFLSPYIDLKSIEGKFSPSDTVYFTPTQHGTIPTDKHWVLTVTPEEAETFTNLITSSDKWESIDVRDEFMGTLENKIYVEIVDNTKNAGASLKDINILVVQQTDQAIADAEKQ